uniref:Uncharacterized protein n=1 Tax=Candidatus Methanophagaceae archaeon ANME-1 ERB6 TaxID=2759912 RepID=A0A7G9YZA8_9EURY|nr:hypothetical protein GMAEILFI_00014 [Methanosarcinales archaeon ANME-1 ERB6]
MHNLFLVKTSVYASANPKYSFTSSYSPLGMISTNFNSKANERNIYSNPCLLATLSFNSSPNSFACSSVNFDLERLLSAKIHNISSSISSASFFNSDSFFDSLTADSNLFILSNSCLKNARNRGCKSTPP